jgi:hypothetical protein
MPQGKAHQVWIEQCEAAQTIRTRFGLKAAFDYLVGEKLLNFAGTAAGGRPKGQSEITRIRDLIGKAFDELGGLEGLVAWASENRGGFYTKIWARSSCVMHQTHSFSKPKRFAPPLFPYCKGDTLKR